MSVEAPAKWRSEISTNPTAYYIKQVASCRALNFPHDHRVYKDHAECTVDRRTW